MLILIVKTELANSDVLYSHITHLEADPHKSLTRQAYTQREKEEIAPLGLYARKKLEAEVAMKLLDDHMQELSHEMISTKKQLAKLEARKIVLINHLDDPVNGYKKAQQELGFTK